MPNGWLYNTWLTLSKEIIDDGNGVEGLCGSGLGCNRRFIPRLPSLACGTELQEQGEHCYPVETQNAILPPTLLSALELQAGLPQSTRERVSRMVPAPESRWPQRHAHQGPLLGKRQQAATERSSWRSLEGRAASAPMVQAIGETGRPTSPQGCSVLHWSSRQYRSATSR